MKPGVVEEKMNQNRRSSPHEPETAFERFAQLPFGLILFIMMIIGLSYYFDGKTSQAKGAQQPIVQVDRQR